MARIILSFVLLIAGICSAQAQSANENRLSFDPGSVEFTPQNNFTVMLTLRIVASPTSIAGVPVKLAIPDAYSVDNLPFGVDKTFPAPVLGPNGRGEIPLTLRANPRARVSLDRITATALSYDGAILESRIDRQLQPTGPLTVVPGPTMPSFPGINTTGTLGFANVPPSVQIGQPFTIDLVRSRFFLSSETASVTLPPGLVQSGSAPSQGPLSVAFGQNQASAPITLVAEVSGPLSVLAALGNIAPAQATIQVSPPVLQVTAVSPTDATVTWGDAATYTFDVTGVGYVGSLPLDLSVTSPGTLPAVFSGSVWSPPQPIDLPSGQPTQVQLNLPTNRYVTSPSQVIANATFSLQFATSPFLLPISLMTLREAGPFAPLVEPNSCPQFTVTPTPGRNPTVTVMAGRSEVASFIGYEPRFSTDCRLFSYRYLDRSSQQFVLTALEDISPSLALSFGDPIPSAATNGACENVRTVLISPDSTYMVLDTEYWIQGRTQCEQALEPTRFTRLIDLAEGRDVAATTPRLAAGGELLFDELVSATLSIDPQTGAPSVLLDYAFAPDETLQPRP